LKGTTGTIDDLSRSIANARVDLNPHQVDAALFAVRSPLSRGAVLADEVGLGKTIEAGIVLAQRWAERRRHLLLILPANLRKQWAEELAEKFSLSSIILESKSYNQFVKGGHHHPFDQPEQVVICSYHFAAAKATELSQIIWDLVVIDEAHRLRNVYKPGNKIARVITDALARAPKLLLTATPLQNSLLELYGLVSVIDEHVFGDPVSFRLQFLQGNDERGRNAVLRERLRPVCIRTLRKQVMEYIRFTQRIPITEKFYPSDDEHQLYELVSAYLQRDVLFALPTNQRKLITLILRKLLASSTFAIAGTLRGLQRRLEESEQMLLPIMAEDYEATDEVAEEWDEETGEVPEGNNAQALRAELDELRRYADLAESIRQNTKGEKLLTALQAGFEKAIALGAEHKAVIFTESRRTQQYLYELLSAHGYTGQIVLINGSNSDQDSKAIYARWKARHAGTAAITGSRTADMKAALVEEFRDYATLLVATESAAEGVNLQFCSLVVNFDLPWNPQRIEQRIGRCHRYGQKHDVVVVNFLNMRNAADQRVFELLSEKFQLFDGVFGASDEVLGAIESGVDFEKRIVEVYQCCRTEEEIQAAFDTLHLELDEQIQTRMLETRRLILENFDEDVQRRLRIHRDKAIAALTDRQEWLLGLARVELDGAAQFVPDEPRFNYTGDLAEAGHYHLDWRKAEVNGDYFFRSDHPLALQLYEQAQGRILPPASVTFQYQDMGRRISVLNPLIGKGGWLELARLTVDAFDTEEFLVFSAHTDDGQPLDDDQCQKLFTLAATVDTPTPLTPSDQLAVIRQERVAERLRQAEARSTAFFDEEVNKLDLWAEDLKAGLERELKELDRDIREARKRSTAAPTLAEKVEAQKEIRELESKRSRKRRELYDAQDEIDRRRDGLIEQIEQRLQQRHSAQPLFSIRWRLA